MYYPQSGQQPTPWIWRDSHVWGDFRGSLHASRCSCRTAGSSSAGRGGTGRHGTAAGLQGCALCSPAGMFDRPSPALLLLLSVLEPRAPTSSATVWFYICDSGTRFSPGSLWVSELRPDLPVQNQTGTAARWSGAPARRSARKRRPLWSVSWLGAYNVVHRMKKWPCRRCGDIPPPRPRPSSAVYPSLEGVVAGLGVKILKIISTPTAFSRFHLTLVQLNLKRKLHYKKFSDFKIIKTCVL